jgi:hypothetical protein
MQKQSGCLQSMLVHLLSSGFFLVLGLAGLGWGGAELVQGWLSQSWPTTEGVVTDSRILIGYDSEGNASHEVRISYSYVVDDVTYTADRLSAASHFASGDLRRAEEFSLQYGRGTAVTVTYDPRNPEQAVLQPGPQRRSWWVAAISGIIAIVGVSGLLSALRARQRDKDAPAL